MGAKIFLTKKIPIGSGLGGGSSNAATVLIVLNKFWKTEFTLKELALFGLEIGADVPFFVMGKTAVGEGIGEILHPVKQKETWCLVVFPKIEISTKKIFSDFFIPNSAYKKSIRQLLKLPFNNDFEYIVTKRFNKIKKLISMLSFYTPSRLTGTGSCVFAQFKNKKLAKNIFSLLPKNVTGFIVKSANISPLHKTLQEREYMFSSLKEK